MGLRITVPERCLLYLLDRGDVREDDPAAQEAVQERIAESLGVRRSHVSRAMGRMHARGLVKTAKVHVAGELRRRLAYFLTEDGLRRAQALRRRLEDFRLPVIDLQGGEALRRLYEVALLLPRRPRLSDLVTSISGDRLDLRRFVDRQARLKEGKVYDAREAADPVYFRGRAIELDRLDAFLADPLARGVLIVGLPGIGKTALASHWAARQKGRVHVLWRRLRPETTPTDLIRDIATLLAGAGRPALASYLERPQEGSTGLAASLLRKDIAQTPSLLVFDDAHLAGGEVGALLRDLLGIDAPSVSIKVLILSRERVDYLRAEDFARNRVWELELGDLDGADSLSVLQALGTPAAERPKIVERFGGHPLSLELAGAGRLPLTGARRTSLALVTEEALSRLGPKERLALGLASVFEGAVPVSPLGSEARELVRRCLLREVEDGTVVVHDLIREAVLGTFSAKQLAALHQRAGRILVATRDPADVVAAVRHFIKGGDFSRAAAIVLEGGEGVIDAGLAGSLLPLLADERWALAKKPLPPRLRLVEGQALFALGRRGEASRAFRRARGASDPLTDAEARLGQGKAELTRGSGLALPLLLDARDRLERLGALGLLAEAQYWIGGVHEDADALEDAQEAFERGRAVAFDVGDRRWEGLCTYGLGRLLSRREDFSGAVEREREALRLLERGGHRPEVAKVCVGLGGNLLELGRFDEAEEYINRAAAESRAMGAMATLASALYNLFSIRNERRDIAGTVPLLEEALEASEMIEEHDLAAWSAASLAFAFWDGGREDLANQHVRRAEAFIERMREPAVRIRSLQLLATACKKAGRSESARRYLERGLSEAGTAKLARLKREITADLREPL